MRGRAGKIAALVALSALCAGPALGSGGPPPEPLYIDPRGGTPAELSRLYAGRLGVMMPTQRDGLLYLDWRLLNGLRVGEEAGKALSVPCCNAADIFALNRGVFGWLDARRGVPGVPESPYYLSTERAGPDYTTIPNCFPDAFDTAAATLANRISRFGRNSPAIKVWLLTQDKVFETCSTPGVTLPAPMPNAPAWLRADRAYQEAAWALYDGRNVEAAERFGAIFRDTASPWQPMALYLSVRATQREALRQRTPESFAAARAAIGRLAAAPEGSYGRGEAGKMLRALDYREQPDKLRAVLEEELGRPEPTPDIAAALKDFLRLNEKASQPPPVVDWIRTLDADDRKVALDHAMERWAATRHHAWLLAALSLVQPEEAEATGLVRDASEVGPADPAWLTTRYHLIRLTIAKEDPGLTRRRLDSILARRELSLSERNLFSAARAQVALSLDDLARLSVRRAYCGAYDGRCSEGAAEYTEGLARVGPGETYAGFGPDARALIDRLPLKSRLALSRMSLLPRELRLDLALTGFARAVQLQDEPTVEALARDLAVLLPQMRADWRAIAAARPGPARRFAEYFAMAKLPGLRVDLDLDYTRPVGTVIEFQGYWRDWMIVPRGSTAGPAEFPEAGRYGWSTIRNDGDDTVEDLTCLFECGQGGFPLHLPAFVAAVQDEAAKERRAFGADGDSDSWPQGTLSVWEEALAYARAHPRDPRIPELLYRLIRIDRWGVAREQLGRRAFQLLHQRYPRSIWAKRSPYWYE